jgi:SAM-dependent methyltransferase
MVKEFIFDRPHTIDITKARIDFLNNRLPDLLRTYNVKNALDIGCGVGYFSRYLRDLRIEVTGLDGRTDNIREAQRRHPDINFIIQDIEDLSVRKLGLFDLVFCFGLLYHLENPFLAIRNLHALTKNILMIESMICPSSNPVARLIDEGNTEDQSLNYIALVPSESGLIKMLYRGGFPYVYLSDVMPDHEEFRQTYEFHRRRTILIAGKVPVNLPCLRPVANAETSNPWLRPLGHQLNRFYRFLRCPLQEKRESVRSRFSRL